MSLSRRYRGFTLIELLIVVAIIAILAAIAVPNFLEAQIRSKVSRTKADMRSLATALEAYYTDNNAYPAGNSYGVAGRVPGTGVPTPNNKVLENLSTPIAYVTTAFFQDPFKAKKRSGSLITSDPATISAAANLGAWTATPSAGDPQYFLYTTYLYMTTAPAVGSNAANASGIMRVVGASGEPKPSGYILNSASPVEAYVNAGGVVAGWQSYHCLGLLYDPTNGTVSFGNIWRGGGSPGNRNNIYGALDSQK